MAGARNRVVPRLLLSLKVAASAFKTCEECHVHLNFIGGKPPREHKPGLLLTCCDEVYYSRFANPLIETARRNSPNQHLHIHVYEPTEAWKSEARRTVEDYGRLTLSWEDARRNPFRDAATNYIYFAAARFAVARQIVEQSRSAALLIDSDGLIVKSLDEPFATFEGHDIGLIRRRSVKPWQKNLAGAVLIQPTQAGIDFIGRVADVLQMVLSRRPEFHVDQLVIHYVDRAFQLSSRRLRVFPLTEEFADWRFLPDSYIWSAKGARKLGFADLVERITGASPAE